VSALRRRGLKLDDPLGPSQTPRPHEPPAQPDNAPIRQATQNRRETNDDRTAKPTSAPRRTSRAQRQRPATVDKQPAAAAAPAAQTATGVWREWSATTSVGSFRLPHELLIELSDTARELGLPIGLIVAAAITQLLDQPSEQIAALVDRADDARIHGRRRARRQLSKPSDD
jgi:hypothetical protein